MNIKVTWTGILLGFGLLITFLGFVCSLILIIVGLAMLVAGVLCSFVAELDEHLTNK